MRIHPRPSLTVVVVLALAVLAAACTKSEPAPPHETTRDAGAAADLLGKDGLAAPQGMAAQGKGAIVAQQCALACGAKPGIDSTPCTHACIAACGSAVDVAAIDACAAKTADGQPKL